jgi:HK97 family phage portal protein
MAWYNEDIFKIFSSEQEQEKANPAQPLISDDEGKNIPTREQPFKYTFYYENLEIVNRAVNLIVDDVSQISFKVGILDAGASDSAKAMEEKEALDKSVNSLYRNKKVAIGTRKATVLRLLNERPNSFQDISTFRRNLIIDYLMDGNIFIYFDGAELFQLPANKVEIIPDKISYITKYVYDNRTDFFPNEIIHIKENSFNSIYRGVPRLKPATRTMKLLYDMRKFQDNFFKNSAIPGLVIKTPNTLSEKIKERTIRNWVSRYNPTSGGYTPMILDGGTELDKLVDIDFKKIGFQESVTANERIILEALGVPHVLFEGGNNANIRPNHRLYYLETVLPIVIKIREAYSRFFGFTVMEDVSNVPALQPELKEQAAFYSTLVNGGILTGNEGRIGVGLEPLDDEAMNQIRVPANIAGSAVDPSQGGRPEEIE